jgi:voltage-gated potassium channel
MSVERWERRSEVPLLLLALAFLVAYAWPVLDPRIDPTLATFLDYISCTVWAAFAIDFAVRLALASERGSYALRHWYDVALIALPVLRPLRLLRLLAFLRILNRSAVGNLAGRVTTYVIGAALMAVGLGAVAALDAEQDAPDANITSIAAWFVSSLGDDTRTAREAQASAERQVEPQATALRLRTRVCSAADPGPHRPPGSGPHQGRYASLRDGLRPALTRPLLQAPLLRYRLGGSLCPPPRSETQRSDDLGRLRHTGPRALVAAGKDPTEHTQPGPLAPAILGAATRDQTHALPNQPHDRAAHVDTGHQP